MSGGATAFRSRDALPHQRKNEHLSVYAYPRAQNPRQSPNGPSHYPQGRSPKVASPSPPFSVHAQKSSFVDHSTRSSSTYLSPPSHPSSNRSSTTTTNPGEHHFVSRQSGRGTPSSKSSHSSKQSDRMHHAQSDSFSVPRPSSKAQTLSEVELDRARNNQPEKSPKKKGFSIFSFFRRSKKKQSSLSKNATVEETTEDPVLSARDAADARAEELRQLHEEEFSKLRRQREKDKNRSVYDMLPANRQAKNELASRNVSYDSSDFDASSPSGFLSPVPRIRSSSSSSTCLPRPSSNYQPSHFNPNYANHAASRSSTHFPSPQFEKPTIYGASSGAHHSTDSVHMQHARNLARSPLIPSHQPVRQSFYPPGKDLKSQPRQSFYPSGRDAQPQSHQPPRRSFYPGREMHSQQPPRQSFYASGREAQSQQSFYPQYSSHHPSHSFNHSSNYR